MSFDLELFPQHLTSRPNTTWKLEHSLFVLVLKLEHPPNLCNRGSQYLLHRINENDSSTQSTPHRHHVSPLQLSPPSPSPPSHDPQILKYQSDISALESELTFTVSSGSKSEALAEKSERDITTAIAKQKSGQQSEAAKELELARGRKKKHDDAAQGARVKYEELKEKIEGKKKYLEEQGRIRGEWEVYQREVEAENADKKNANDKGWFMSGRGFLPDTKPVKTRTAMVKVKKPSPPPRGSATPDAGEKDALMAELFGEE